MPTTDESSLPSTLVPTTSNSVSMTTSKETVTDIEQSETTVTMSRPSPVESNLGTVVGGAVGGLVIVIIVAVAMVIVVLLVVVRRGQTGSMKVASNGSGGQAYNNALYGEGKQLIKNYCLWWFLFSTLYIYSGMLVL